MVFVPVLFVVLLGCVAARAQAFDSEQVRWNQRAGAGFCASGLALRGRRDYRSDAARARRIVHTTGPGGPPRYVYFFAFVVAIRVLHLSPSAAALFALGAAFPGSPFFGPAVLGGLFGQSSALAIASTAIVSNLLLLPITVVVLEAAGRVRRSSPEILPKGPRKNEAAEAAMLTVASNSVLQAVKRPYVWAQFVGLVLVLIGIQVPSLINSMLNLIGETTSGVSLFVSGLLLAAYSLKLNADVAINAIFKSIVEPAVWSD